MEAALRIKVAGNAPCPHGRIVELRTVGNKIYAWTKTASGKSREPASD